MKYKLFSSLALIPLLAIANSAVAQVATQKGIQIESSHLSISVTCRSTSDSEEFSGEAALTSYADGLNCVGNSAAGHIFAVSTRSSGAQLIGNFCVIERGDNESVTVEGNIGINAAGRADRLAIRNVILPINEEASLAGGSFYSGTQCRIEVRR